MNTILFYISLVATIALFVTFLVLNIRFVKNKITQKDYKHHLIKVSWIAGGFVLAFLVMMLSIYLAQNMSGVKWYHYLCSIFGSLLSGASFILFIGTFILHYYDPEKDPILDKWLYRIMIWSIPVFFIFLFIMSEGYAAYLNYPIINGIYIGKDGVFWVTPKSSHSPTIAFYAIAILSGALFVYFLCDHKMYVQYGKHGLLESTFLVAFPSGIIGARVFYVIGNWELEFAGQDWTKVFAIHEGGLTILGGAIVGIVVGVLWFMWRKKGYNIWIAVDIIVPTILLAQAIGRWGNYFNVEVHGNAVSDVYWQWLPTIILENLRYSSTHAGVLVNQIYVPLFLIECVTNIIGYFVLSSLFGKKLRKYTQFGDLAFGYIIWYGLTRTIMEPLRDSTYNMGVDGYWSWMWSIVFIACGFLLIMLNHLIRYYLAKRRKSEDGQPIVIRQNFKGSLIGLIVFAVLALSCLISGICLMTLNVQPLELAFNAYNMGLIVLVFGLSFLFIDIIYIPHFVDAVQQRKSHLI